MCEVISLCSQPTCDAEVTAKCFKSGLQWELRAHNGAIFVRHSSPTSPVYCRNQNKSGSEGKWILSLPVVFEW